MKKRTKKAGAKDTLGARPEDRERLSQCLKELSWTQTWLSKEAGISQQMINDFLKGKRNFSPAASDRVMTVIAAGFDKKKAADKPRLSPEAAERTRQRTAIKLGEIPDEQQYDEYDAFIEVRNAVDPDGLLSAREALISLGGPPRDPHAYEAWKAKQIELHAAASELPVARAWIKHLEEQRSNLQKQISLLEQLKSSHDEVVSLYQGMVERLKKQLLDTGITPTD